MNKQDKQKIEQYFNDTYIDGSDTEDIGITEVAELGSYDSDDDGTFTYTLVKFLYNGQRMYVSIKEDNVGLGRDKVSIRTHKQIENNAMIQVRKPNLD